MIIPSLIVAALVQVASPARADTTPPAAAIETAYLIRSGALGLGATLTMPRGASGRVPERLHAARRDARLVVLPEVNHVLKRVADRTLAGQGPTYTDPSLAIAPEVVTTIAEWILALR